MDQNDRGDPQADAPKEMTVREAGALGGAARKRALGKEGYSALGKLGGAQTSKRHGPAFYSAIGKMGGDLVKARYGDAHFQDLGKKGGARVRELISRGKERQQHE